MRRAATLAALAGAAVGGSVTWQGGSSCPEINVATWGSKECWSPQPPTSSDTVVIAGSSNVRANTTDGNETVRALTLGGLVVEVNASLLLAEGVFVLQGNASVQGTLVMQSGWGTRAWQITTMRVSNPDDLQDDKYALEAGLRQCRYLPAGFTPRLCGPGSVVVESGGALRQKAGLYASVFGPVHVKKGGQYTAETNTFQWGRIRNEGYLSMGSKNGEGNNQPYIANPHYFHGILDNAGEATMISTYYDLYTHNESHPSIENVSSYVFTNTGNLTISLDFTAYWYPWYNNARGLYLPSVQNLKGGRLCLSGRYTHLVNEGEIFKRADIFYKDVELDSAFVNRGSINHGAISTLTVRGDVHNYGILNASKTMAAGTVTNLEGAVIGGWVQVSFLENRGAVSNPGLTLFVPHVTNIGTMNAIVYGSTFNNTKNGIVTGSDLHSGVISNDGEIHGSRISRAQHFVNTGRVLDNTGIESQYTNNTGTINGTLFPGGVFVNAEGSTASLSVAQYSNITNHGNLTWVSTSTPGWSGCDLYNSGHVWIKDTTRFHLISSTGTIFVDNALIFGGHAKCVGCHFYLLNGGEIHLQSISSSETARRFVRGGTLGSRSHRNTPKLCSTGTCFTDPCRYAAGLDGAVPCTDLEGRAGAQPYPDYSTYCYACEWVPPLGLLNDANTLKQLAKGTPTTDVGHSFRDEEGVLYHFEKAVIGGDGSGAVVMGGTVNLEGKGALRVKAGSVASVVEGNRPVVVGGGELVFGKGTTGRIGLKATLEDGGVLRARPGAKVIIEAWAHVRATNHTIRMDPGSLLHVEGTLHMHSDSTVSSCARTTGIGQLVLDDASASAMPCVKKDIVQENAGSCGGKCVGNSGCSGLCSQCAEGECVEPVCTSDASCSYNGRCVGGACITCDVAGSVGVLPFTGLDCSKVTGISRFSEVTFAARKNTTNPVPVAPVLTAHGLLSTYSVGCAGSTARDYLAWNSQSVWYRPGAVTESKMFVQLVQHSSSNAFLLADGEPSRPNVGTPDTLFFEYPYPALDEGCKWEAGNATHNTTYGRCVGVCSSGKPCAINSMNGCGCTDCPTPDPHPPKGKCRSYIASAPWGEVGDCEPTMYTDSKTCFCNRVDSQSIQGTAGCPTYPTVQRNPRNTSTVLVFYNVGDGNTVGMAEGPKEGPWKVVHEPVLSGYQNVFPYISIGDVIHFVADKLMPDGTTTIRHLTTPDLGTTWIEGKEDFIGLTEGKTTFMSRSKPRLFWTWRCAQLYTEGLVVNATAPGLYSVEICPVGVS
eukprot:Hpha_TRINITY_DN421_c0_g1::TRINITY_DN421_c0_g1_i1::g.27638::m.27638